jgi:hypothetical protein
MIAPRRARRNHRFRRQDGWIQNSLATLIELVSGWRTDFEAVSLTRRAHGSSPYQSDQSALALGSNLTYQVKQNRVMRVLRATTNQQRCGFGRTVLV